MKSIRVLCLILVLMFFAVGCKKKSTETTTPLHRAAEEGNIEGVRSLIASGAEINAKDLRGCIPLHIAAEHGQKAVAEVLIAKGADINAKVEKRRWRSHAPLHIAVLKGQKEIVELLHKHGAEE